MSVKRLSALLLLLVAFASCEKTDPYSVIKIKGTWIMQSVNSDQLSTDSRSILVLEERKSACTVAMCYSLGGDERQWIVNSGLKWDFHGTVLEINGIDELGNVWAQSSTFLHVDDNELKIINNGSSLEAGQSGTQATNYHLNYSRIAGNNDYSGTWDCTEADGTASSGHRITISGDNVQHYGMQDGSWTALGSGTMYIYGNFIAINYNENGKRQCKMYDCELTSSESGTTWTWTNSTDGTATSKIVFTKAAE